MSKVFNTKCLSYLEVTPLFSKIIRHLRFLNARGNHTGAEGQAYQHPPKDVTTMDGCHTSTTAKDDKNPPKANAGSDYLRLNLRECLKLQSEWTEHAQAYAKHMDDMNTDPTFADFKPIKYEGLKVVSAWSSLFTWYLSNIEQNDSSLSADDVVDDDDEDDEVENYIRLVDKNKCPARVMAILYKELTKLMKCKSKSSEGGHIRDYLDWLTALPWGNYSKENDDIKLARRILDEEHYGLVDVKKRILEFIAVGILKGTTKGKIICLSGPPGVGKTSIARSIARALGRRFYKICVGGLSDAREIRGNLRCFSNSRPGKMVIALKSVGTMNPVILIDEIDKLGNQERKCELAHALLELLDPDHNVEFLDSYLGFPVDMSTVLFVCTANDEYKIPNPLRDRMEIISISGYTNEEKMHIARDYLDRSVREACGVKPEQSGITDAALLALVENYCREGGVRNLKKHIEKIYCKVAFELVEKGVRNKALPALLTEAMECPARDNPQLETETK